MQHSNPLSSDIAQRYTFFRGIKDWIHGFWGYIMDQLYMPSEEAWHNCLHVAPPLMFTVMSFQATPINILAVSSLSLRIYQYNKLDMRFCKQNFMIFSIPIRSISSCSTIYPWGSGYLFPKRWNWQICHTHQAFKLPFCIFSGKLQTFPTVKSKTIEFLLNLTQQYTPVLFAKTPCELLPEKSC